jgi:hypothetical protein
METGSETEKCDEWDTVPDIAVTSLGLDAIDNAFIKSLGKLKHPYDGNVKKKPSSAPSTLGQEQVSGMQITATFRHIVYPPNIFNHN